VILASFDFIDEDLAFLREEDLNLFFAKIGPFEQTSSKLSDSRFAGGSLVPSMLNIP